MDTADHSTHRALDDLRELFDLADGLFSAVTVTTGWAQLTPTQQTISRIGDMLSENTDDQIRALGALTKLCLLVERPDLLHAAAQQLHAAFEHACNFRITTTEPAPAAEQPTEPAAAE